jgi:hypothetical protein
MTLLRWLLPRFTLGIGGDSGGGDSGQQAAQDEARKATLRARIDSLYGIKPSGPALQPVPDGGGWNLGRPIIEAQNKQAQGQFDENAPVADAATKQMAAERGQVSDATRGYYSDQLARSFAAAERNNRFNLARQGLQGGSTEVDTNRELQTDQSLGATRIDQAARAAAASLDQQREQERMNAISLVNSGAGESAVASAQAGLRNSLQNVSTQQRANLFGDLFTTGADAFSSQNYNAALAAQLARFQSSLGAFYPTRTSSGAVTPSG